MDNIPSLFEQLFVARKHYRARGWINIDCPECGDTRQRCGFKRTDNAGFLVSCLNGGCALNVESAGWTPGYFFSGRLKKLYSDLGGDIRELPLKDMAFQNRKIIHDKNGNVIGQEQLEIVTNFPEIELPERAIPLLDAAEKNHDALEVFEYLIDRWADYPKYYNFYWSPKWRNNLIIPFFHKEKVVGYASRNIKIKTGKGRYYQTCAADFMFNQDKIFNNDEGVAIVVESPLDAIALDCYASKASHLTKKQINLLNASGKEIILVPDHRIKEYESFLNIAIDNNWSLAVPDWGSSLLDAGDSIKKNGALFTLDIIVTSASKNYIRSRSSLKLKAQ